MSIMIGLDSPNFDTIREWTTRNIKIKQLLWRKLQ